MRIRRNINPESRFIGAFQETDFEKTET